MSLAVAMTGAALLAACGDTSGPRGPGTLEATLVSPNGPEGAVVLALVGSGIDSITASSPFTYVQHDGGTTRLVIVLADPGTVAFEVWVDDVSDPPSVTVVEVADGNNELRSSVTGYRVDFVPVEAPPNTATRAP